jgi:hypothetical protein
MEDAQESWQRGVTMLNELGDARQIAVKAAAVRQAIEAGGREPFEGL